MRPCPECNKQLATDGGFEVHMELAHSVKAGPEARPAAPVVATTRPTSSAPEPERPQHSYDLKVVVNAALIALLLLSGVAVALNRSAARPSSLATASSPEATSTPTPAAAPTVPITSAPPTPPPTPPLTQPPLFSQTPSHQSTPATAAPQTATGCQSVINTLSSRPSTRTVDAGDLMAAHTFPGPLIPGVPIATVIDEAAINSLSEFAAQSDPNSPDDQKMLQLLRQSGFNSMHATEFDTAGSQSIAVAFRFSTPAAALAFDRGLLTEECTQEGMRNAKAIPGLTGGISFVDDGDAPYSAAFVAGDTVLALGVCDCAGASQAVAAQWAQNVASRLGAV